MYHFRLYLLILILAGLFACSGNTENKAKKKEARIEFKKNTHDFGNIDFGGDGTCEFVFTNTGKVPLVLSNVTSSCGCTVPDWPHEPVKAGENEIIRVSYDTYKEGAFTKSVTVLSNAENSPVRLFIKGRVKRAEDNS